MNKATQPYPAQIFLAYHLAKSVFSGLKNFAVKKCLLAICALAGLYGAGFAQTGFVADKLDPVFRLMLEQTKSRVPSPKDPPPPLLQIAPTRGFASKGAQPEERYECIVYTTNPQKLRDSNIIINSVFPGFATAWVTPVQMMQLSQMPEVRFIEAPAVNYPTNDVVVGGSGASLLHQGGLNNTAYKGKNVIIGIYDSGIDWDHLDFRNPADTTKSRILRIWDQTITATAGEAPPAGFSYGVEYTQAQINNELDGTPANTVREKDITGHGTHVAGIAAGNGAALPSKRYAGMAPEADIVIIKGSDTTFNTARIIDGLTYLQNLATALGKPAVMNMSLGSPSGPHDGTLAYEKAIDNFTSSAAGRVVVVAAGNENGTNIHNRIGLTGNASASMSFAVSDSTASDVFGYRAYVNDSSDVTATVTAPDGRAFTANARQVVAGRVLADSFTVVLYNLVDPANFNRYIEIYVYRTNNNTRRPTGTWNLSITNNTSNTLTIHGWLYYKNKAFTATTLVGGNSDYLLSSPANATSAVSVASFIGKNNWYSNAVPNGYSFPGNRSDSISTFSSRGPRRDGLLKPEIASMGEAVISTLSSDAAASYNSAYIAEKGLYVENQGTSMASPGVAGAAALLLQASPSATASQVKNLLTTAANKDALTEIVVPTPNPIWGYGKLDVYKAASLLFNCGPAERRTYRYDSATRNGQEGAYSLAGEKMGIRFTPDVSGKLGGVFFHTNTATTALAVEVRSASGGMPGNLLGVINLDSNRISKYAFNYTDLSSLNIPVTAGIDYFVVLARAPSGSNGWSLRYENLVLNGRSVFSTNGGVSWLSLNGNLKIRPVVFNNAQLAGAIATTNSTDARGINTSSQFINLNCQLINQLVPSGTNPVSGMVTSKVWIEGTVQHYNTKPYVQRHYDVSVAGAATSGRLTLYFTQAEFNSFNADAASMLDLPTGPSDMAGIANLRIDKYTGSTNNGTGLIGTYSGPGSTIDPADADIVFNAPAGRWEISFVDTGFGGYFIKTETFVLPIREEYFRGNIQGIAHVLNWKISCTTSAMLTVERSADGINYSGIGNITATPYDCTQPFTFTDAAPLAGNNYYRIRIVQPAGNALYTSTILLQNGRQLVTRLFPTLIRAGGRVQVGLGDATGYLQVTDATGRQILRRILSNGVQSIDLGLRTKGIYFYTIKKDQTVLASGKIVVE